MPRILIAECKQEISSFNPVICTYDRFTINTGDQLFAYHDAVETEVNGALGVFRQRPDLELVPAYGARATSAGPLSQESFTRISDEFLAADVGLTGAKGYHRPVFCGELEHLPYGGEREVLLPLGYHISEHILYCGRANK